MKWRYDKESVFKIVRSASSLSGLIFLVVILGCKSRSQSIASPDNSKTIVTSVETSKADPKIYLCVVFEIQDMTGRVLHRENTRASDTMRWNLSWASTNIIRLVSSDIGTYDWEEQPDGTWRKATQ